MLAVAAALAALAIPAVPVDVQYGPCPDQTEISSGCYYAGSNTAYVQRPGDKYVYWHELGHALDAQRINDGERHRFTCLPAMNSPEGESRCGQEWTGDSEEQFADAYANCKLGFLPSTSRFSAGSDYLPSTDRRALNACRFIVRAAR